MTPIFPQRVYFAASDFGKWGIGFCAEFTESLDEALDNSLDSDEKPFRIFCAEFDPDTNLPERLTDVTEDAINARNEILVAKGIDPIAT